MIANLRMRTFLIAIHCALNLYFLLLYYLASFLEVPIAAVVVGFYNAIVLGFLGGGFGSSPLLTLLLGFLPFAVMGFCWGFIAEKANIRTKLTAAFVTLPATLLLCVALSLATHFAYGVKNFRPDQIANSTSANSGEGGVATPLDDAQVEELAWAIKGDSFNGGPLQIDDRVEVVSLEQLSAKLVLLPNGVSLAGGPFSYVSLDPATWRNIRAQEPGHYIIFWGKSATSDELHVAIVFNTKTEYYSCMLVDAQELARLKSELRGAILNVAPQSAPKVVESLGGGGQ